jgi:hypothetical protein
MKATPVRGRLIVVCLFNAQIVTEQEIISVKMFLASVFVFISVMAVAADPQSKGDVIGRLVYLQQSRFQ